MLGKQALKRLTKAVFRLAAILGLEPMLQVGAEATETGEMCLKGEHSAGESGSFWLWLTMFAIVLLLVGFETVVFFAWKKLTSDLTQCWNQAADENTYIHQQEVRIHDLLQQVDRLRAPVEQSYVELGDTIQTTSNELSMIHDALGYPMNTGFT
eukprot:s4482_g2.t1